MAVRVDTANNGMIGHYNISLISPTILITKGCRLSTLLVIRQRDKLARYETSTSLFHQLLADKKGDQVTLGAETIYRYKD